MADGISVILSQAGSYNQSKKSEVAMSAKNIFCHITMELNAFWQMPRELQACHVPHPATWP